MISYEGVENSGSMEPHVFTRFSKIKIDAKFVFEEDDKAPILYIDENLHLEPESEELLTEFFATLAIFNLLTDILSHTLRIKNLTVALDLQMTILDRRDDDGLEGSDYDHEQETKEELAGSVRAMELFLDTRYSSTTTSAFECAMLCGTVQFASLYGSERPSLRRSPYRILQTTRPTSEVAAGHESADRIQLDGQASAPCVMWSRLASCHRSEERRGR